MQFVKPMPLKYSVMLNICQMLKKVFVHFCIAVLLNLNLFLLFAVTGN